MFHTIHDFTAEWKKETEITGRVLDALTDESLKQEIASGYRTLGQLAWHLVWSLGYMTQMGLAFAGPEGEELAPASAAKIANEYRRVSQAMLQAMESQWTDAMLAQGKEVQGGSWTNGYSLHFLIQHEVHHRGQLTILMRQAGLNVPGVYGPTRDEWIAQGKKPLI